MAFNQNKANAGAGAVKRVQVWFGLLVLIVGIFGVRLFYVQVIRYDHFKQAALHNQLKQKQIPASRGIIEAYDGNSVVPIVLNQTLYTIFADPVDMKTYHTDPQKVAAAAASVLGGKYSDYEQAVTAQHTRYSILAKKVSKAQRDKLMGYKFAGLYSEAQDYRIYPQGDLAAQTLGFVNANGQGEYGVEQAMNKQLAGQPGELKAITDLNGVPLAASSGNVQRPPVAGDTVTLTLDIGMQAQMQKILKDEYKKTESQGLSAVILDANSGQIKAMASYPSYNPANYGNTGNPKYFENGAVTDAIEPGSTMKLLTTAAAIDQGVIGPNTTFYDPAHWIVDGFNITDIEEDGGARVQSIKSLLNLSLNTGATWELMQMGGGKIDAKARDAWHDYMVNHFLLGHPTNIAQGYESAGYVPGPEQNGAGINLTYANTSFGQGVLVTPLQMAAADASILNGGTYYQPHVVAKITHADGSSQTIKPKVLVQHTVSAKTSSDMPGLMEYVVQGHLDSGYEYLRFSSKYSVGGKTGTAQIAKPGGGYYADKFNGTYAGFVGGDHPQYVIVVYNIQPGVGGYAGSNGGQPVFADLAHMLIDGGYVMPKSQ